MSEKVRLIKKYRDTVRYAVRLTFRQYDSADITSDAGLYAVLVHGYEEVKKECASLAAEGARRSLQMAARTGLFIFAVGLFTYGRLEMAEEIAANTPQGLGHVRYLAGILNVLLPLPEGTIAMKMSDAVLEWLHENTSKLKWNETESCFAWIEPA